MSHDIVLVDDDPGTVQLLARILARSGTLRFATNGVDAWRLARESTPDLMLLDAEMPGMSEFQVCKTMKADEALADDSQTRCAPMDLVRAADKALYSAKNNGRARARARRLDVADVDSPQMASDVSPRRRGDGFGSRTTQ